MKLTTLDLIIIGVGALCGGFAAGLSTDAANQYVDPHKLFWARLAFASMGTTCTTLLGYLKALQIPPKTP